MQAFPEEEKGCRQKPLWSFENAKYHLKKDSLIKVSFTRNGDKTPNVQCEKQLVLTLKMQNKFKIP